jgi:hypothetical protein
MGLCGDFRDAAGMPGNRQRLNANASEINERAAESGFPTGVVSMGSPK